MNLPIRLPCWSSVVILRSGLWCAHEADPRPRRRKSVLLSGAPPWRAARLQPRCLPPPLPCTLSIAQDRGWDLPPNPPFPFSLCQLVWSRKPTNGAESQAFPCAEARGGEVGRKLEERNKIMTAKQWHFQLDSGMLEPVGTRWAKRTGVSESRDSLTGVPRSIGIWWEMQIFSPHLTKTNWMRISMREPSVLEFNQLSWSF